MNARISFLLLILLLGAMPLRAEDGPAGNAAPIVNSMKGGGEAPRVSARSGEDLVWPALAGATVISLAAILFTMFNWWTSRRPLAAEPSPARPEATAGLAPNLLPVISQAIKEALMQELAAQRRELLSAQQSAAADLTSLARRLEAVQSPLLERLGGPRPSAVPAPPSQREIPVNIFCACGQKYSIDVRPVAGRMPYPIACPICGLDGTPQANQIVARISDGTVTPPAPPSGGPALMNSAHAGLAPQLMEAVRQVVVNELATTRAEAGKTIPFAVVRTGQNGPAAAGNHAGDVVAILLSEGQLLADTGALEKAAKCFDTAHALQPDRAETLVKLGGVFDKLNRAEDALQYYDRAIALDETLTIAYLSKGGLYNRLARYDEALRCYEQALNKQKKSAA